MGKCIALFVLAARRSCSKMAAPLKIVFSSVLQQTVRPFSSTCASCAGKKWRLENGLARIGTEYGPLTDLPDWSFADGRPAPPLKGQIRRWKEREEFARFEEDIASVLRKLAFETIEDNNRAVVLNDGHWSSTFLHKRAVYLNSEMDLGVEAWKAKKEEGKRVTELIKSSMLKPKGNLLLKNKK